MQALCQSCRALLGKVYGELAQRYRRKAEVNLTFGFLTGVKSFNA